LKSQEDETTKGLKGEGMISAGQIEAGKPNNTGEYSWQGEVEERSKVEHIARRSFEKKKKTKYTHAHTKTQQQYNTEQHTDTQGKVDAHVQIAVAENLRKKVRRELRLCFVFGLLGAARPSTKMLSTGEGYGRFILFCYLLPGPSFCLRLRRLLCFIDIATY